MKKLLLITSLLISSVAVASDIIEDEKASAMSFFAEQLKDPDSAKFRNVTAFIRPTKNNPNSVSVCGEITGKNSYGGYTGYKPFYYQEGWGEMLTKDSESTFEMMFNVVCSK